VAHPFGRFEKYLIIFILLLLLFGWLFFNADSRYNRRRIADRCQRLSLEVYHPLSSLDAENALQELIGIASSDWGFAASYACGEIGWLGPLAKDAVPALEAIVRKDELITDSTGSEAIRALGKIGPDAASSVELLALELRTPIYSSRSFYAAKALGQIGKAAIAVLPDLEAVAHLDKNPSADGSAQSTARNARESIKILQALMSN